MTCDLQKANMANTPFEEDQIFFDQDNRRLFVGKVFYKYVLHFQVFGMDLTPYDVIGCKSQPAD